MYGLCASHCLICVRQSHFGLCASVTLWFVRQSHFGLCAPVTLSFVRQSHFGQCRQSHFGQCTPVTRRFVRQLLFGNSMCAPFTLWYVCGLVIDDLIFTTEENYIEDHTYNPSMGLSNLFNVNSKRS